MKLRFILAFCAFVVPAGLMLAQSPAPAESKARREIHSLGRDLPAPVPATEQPGNAETRALEQAASFRAGMAAAVAAGEEKAEAALARLRLNEAPRGRSGGDRDAELAFASVDVGHHLISAGKAAEAEEFFRAADEAFARAIPRAKAEPANQAMLLQAAAYIRVRYLGKVREAKADLDEARKLRPDDQEMQQRAELLGRDKAEIFKEPARG